MQYSVAVHKDFERDAVQRLKAEFGFGSLDARLPMKDFLRRGNGAWVPTTSVMFPGFVIVQSVPELDRERIAACIGDLLYTAHGAEPIRALDDSETRIVHSLTAFNTVIGFSRGEIHRGKLRVLSGPLVGMEPIIGKVDRHKRKAYFKQGLFPGLTRPAFPSDVFLTRDDRQPPLYVGLEVALRS